MIERKQDETINRPEGERLIDAPLLLMDIPAYTQKLRREKQWREGDRNAITLFKTARLRIVLVIMKEGAELHTERPDTLLVIQVMEGSLHASVNGRSLTVQCNQTLAIHEGLSYSIVAAENVVLLLTVAGDEGL